MATSMAKEKGGQIHQMYFFFKKIYLITGKIVKKKNQCMMSSLPHSSLKLTWSIHSFLLGYNCLGTEHNSLPLPSFSTLDFASQVLSCNFSFTICLEFFLISKFP